VEVRVVLIRIIYIYIYIYIYLILSRTQKLIVKFCYHMLTIMRLFLIAEIFLTVLICFFNVIFCFIYYIGRVYLHYMSCRFKFQFITFKTKTYLWLSLFNFVCRYEKKMSRLRNQIKYCDPTEVQIIESLIASISQENVRENGSNK
jgi:hypothetical protein